MRIKVASRLIPNTVRIIENGIHIGHVTQIQGHVILPNNFRIMKTIPNIPGSPSDIICSPFY